MAKTWQQKRDAKLKKEKIKKENQAIELFINDLKKVVINANQHKQNAIKIINEIIDQNSILMSNSIELKQQKNRLHEVNDLMAKTINEIRIQQSKLIQ